VALKQDYDRGNTQQDRAKKAMIQGACLLGIGLMATLATWIFLEAVWILTPIIAAVGAFRLLYGLVIFLTGME
jgi:hypothetical protein